MLSPRTQELVVVLLKAYIDGERQVEVVRQVLAELPTFDPYSAFRYMDYLSQGYLSHAEIIRFMRENRRSMSEYEAGLICASFSGLGSRLVTYEDFLNAVLPASNERLRARATQRPAGRSLDYETSYALCRVLERELDLQVNLEAAKSELRNQRDFTHTALFTFLDSDQDQYVNEADLTYFCRRMGVFLYPDDVKAVFQRLDKDRDGVLSYRELRAGVESSAEGKRDSQSPARSAARSISPIKPGSRASEPLRKSNESVARRSAESRGSDRVSESQHRSVDRRRSPGKVLETPPKSANPHSASKPLPSRLSYGDSTELTATLDAIEKVVTELEREQRALSQVPDFTLPGALELFDASEASGVSLAQFKKGVRRLGLCPDERDIDLAFSRYDRDKDGVLSTRELADILVPRDSREARTRRSGLSSLALEQLMKVLRLAIDGEVQLNRDRNRLYIKKLCDIHSQFQAIDADKDGFWTMADLAKVSNRPTLLHDRLDHDRDGRVSFPDLIEEIVP